MRRKAIATVIAALAAAVTTVGGGSVEAAPGTLPAGAVLRIAVPEAFGGKTVIGQLTADLVDGAGYVTAYGCDDGIPKDSAGMVTRSDLNYDQRVASFASNRLIVEADNDGDVCFYTSRPAALIVDVNAVTFDTGITSFANRRTDTRSGAQPQIGAGDVLRVTVPEAIGGHTIVGQLTVDQVVGAGFVTAFGCDRGLSRDGSGAVSRSDLNFDARVASFASNRLIVEADADGDVCFYTSQPAALIVDVNGTSDVGIGSFPNTRTDTRSRADRLVQQAGVLQINVPEAVGGDTVVGQLTVDQVDGAGFVTAYGCDDGLPTEPFGAVTRSDVNYDSRIARFASNRLIVKADAEGDVCFYTSRPAALIVDVNATSSIGISSFANRRVDTRGGTASVPPGSVTIPGVPVWPPYTAKPALSGVAALTGLPATSAVTGRPILVVKIDNYGPARPQWGLDQADAVFEVNVEGVTRFITLFHSALPTALGPVRSARTADLDLLTAMNRPVFAFSGANPGVTQWIDSAEWSDVLVDFSAQHSGCYSRSPDRIGPHNLLLDGACAVASSTRAGAAQPLWAIDAGWVASGSAVADSTFAVAMDGVSIGWTWDSTSQRYLRSQDDQPHLAVSGNQIAANNVVELTVEHVPSPVDARSPNPITIGSGPAVVHRDGVAVAATWSRATAYDAFVLRDAVSGDPIPLDTGVTFFELVRG